MNIIENLAAYLFPQKFKNTSELSYWKKKFRQEDGVLNNSHYEYFYTEAFKLSKHYYNGKTILDIGCGPRGSLEWATNSKKRIGLDPLVKSYKSLGIDNHSMEYVCAKSECIPFLEQSFDVVTSFNSLDHVDDIGKTLNEIFRVTKQGGTFLLITEINHPPTPTEPHSLNIDILNNLNNLFHSSNHWLVKMRKDVHDIYGSVKDNNLIDNVIGNESCVLCYVGMKV